MSNYSLDSIKVAVKLGLNLSRISSGDLIAPLKVRLWTLQESPSMKGLGSINPSITGIPNS